MSLLVNRKKKVRSRGGRDGALTAMRQLEEDGLGKLVLKKSKRYQGWHVLCVIGNTDMGVS